ncbi:hypothetical protein VTO42DRAFT_7089 [Malbranchea cinnamomea]
MTMTSTEKLLFTSRAVSFLSKVAVFKVETASLPVLSDWSSDLDSRNSSLENGERLDEQINLGLFCERKFRFCCLGWLCCRDVAARGKKKTSQRANVAVHL